MPIRSPWCARGSKPMTFFRAMLIALLAVPPGTAGGFEVGAWRSRDEPPQPPLWYVWLPGRSADGGILDGELYNDIFRLAVEETWGQWLIPPLSDDQIVIEEREPCRLNTTPSAWRGSKPEPQYVPVPIGTEGSYSARGIVAWFPTGPDGTGMMRCGGEVDYEGSNVSGLASNGGVHLSERLRDKDAVQVYFVAAHEVGHNLGLLHSAAQGIMMHGVVGPDGKPDLSIDDVCGLAARQGTLDEECALLLPGPGLRTSGLPTDARFAAGVTVDGGVTYGRRAIRYSRLRAWPGRESLEGGFAVPGDGGSRPGGTGETTLIASFVPDTRHVYPDLSLGANECGGMGLWARDPWERDPDLDCVFDSERGRWGWNGLSFLNFVHEPLVRMHVVAEVDGAYYALEEDFESPYYYSRWGRTPPETKRMVRWDPGNPLPVAEIGLARTALDVSWVGDMREVHYCPESPDGLRPDDCPESLDDPWPDRVPDRVVARFWLAYSIDAPPGPGQVPYPVEYWYSPVPVEAEWVKGDDVEPRPGPISEPGPPAWAVGR